MSYHIISYHIISYIISYIIYHIISYHIASYHVKGTERQVVWDQKKYVFKTVVASTCPIILFLFVHCLYNDDVSR